MYQLVRKYVMKGKWRGRSRKWKEEITNPASYIRKANGRKPGFDFLLMDEAINEAAEQISRIEKPTDFLEAVLVNEGNDDGKIECVSWSGHTDFIISLPVEKTEQDVA